MPSYSRFIFVPVFFLFSLCAFAQGGGTWTWMNGSPLPNIGDPVYGVQGVFDPANTPGRLSQVAHWTDQQGNFWIYGGLGSNGMESALWKYDPSINQWAWMGPDSTTNGLPDFGVQGVPAITNRPGGRSGCLATWMDQQGHLWLFGGEGYDINGNYGMMNDLWEYDIASGLWTWIKGSATAGSGGNYGTLQVPSPSNEPPARAYCAGRFVSTNGDLWLYGGIDGTNDKCDMWRYNIASNTWTWMSGSTTVCPVSYGTLYVPAAGNTPGSRMGFASWTDQQGNFWLFGGHGSTNFADMWKYDPATNLWAWMGGSQLFTSASTFTQQCSPGPDYPSGRWANSATWTDGCGRLWNYGGMGFGGGSLGELWYFDPATNQFTWVSNPTGSNYAGTFGTQGVGAPANHPPSLMYAAGFQDNQGNLWLFGGSRQNPMLPCNTLWKFTPSCAPPITATATASAQNGCAPFPVQFSATAPGGTSYQWNFGDASVTNDTSSAAAPYYTYTTPGTYTCTLIATGSGCSSGQTTVTITVNVGAYPTVNAGSDVSVCAGSTVQLQATGGSSYSWSPAAGLDNAASASPFATPAQTTSYIVSSPNGACVGQDTVNVLVLPLPVVNLPALLTMNYGESVVLNASGGTSYQWSPSDGLSCVNCANPTASPTITTEYCVLATESATGCSSTACVRVEVNRECESVFVPNAFSPNGDGQNDVLFVRVHPECMTQLTFRVYDRWGEKVFETHDPSIGWDGSLRGENANVDVYTYLLEAETIDGATVKKTGNVSLVR